MAFPAVSVRLLGFARTVSQVLLLVLIWGISDHLSHRFIPLLPGSVLGMLLTLILLGFRVLSRHWLVDGATWLLTEMLLFFIPAVLAIIQYPDMVWRHGLGILGVILLSTVCVMLSTVLAVEGVIRLQRCVQRGRKGPG
jgi:holin-like protein